MGICENAGEEELYARGYIDIRIKKQQLVEWLKKVYDLSKISDLEQALSMARYHTADPDEIEVVSTITLLYRAQCSGTLKPPVSIKILYEEIVDEILESEEI